MSRFHRPPPAVPVRGDEGGEVGGREPDQPADPHEREAPVRHEGANGPHGACERLRRAPRVEEGPRVGPDGGRAPPQGREVGHVRPAAPAAGGFEVDRGGGAHAETATARPTSAAHANHATRERRWGVTAPTAPLQVCPREPKRGLRGRGDRRPRVSRPTARRKTASVLLRSAWNVSRPPAPLL